MTRALAAIVWLRWRLLVNSLRHGRRRDTLEQVSRIGSVLALGLIVCASIASVLGAVVLGFTGGWMVGQRSADPVQVLFSARVLLAIALAVLAIAAIGGAAPGGISAHARLVLAPIGDERLHLVKVLARLIDPWIAAVVLGSLAFATGLLASARIGTGAIALAAGLALGAVLVSLGSLLSSSAGWLVRNRRRGEAFTLFFVLGLSLFAMIPAFASHRLERRERADRTHRTAARGFTIAEVEEALPEWSQALPSELYGRTLREALAGRSGPATLGLGLLVAEALALFALSSAVHAKLLASPDSGSRRRRKISERLLAWKLPGASPTVSAVALAQARTALRSVRGRLVVLLPGPVMALVGVLSARAPGELPGGGLLQEHGYLLFAAGIAFSLYALQAFSMNQLASDRAGLSLQLLAPIRDTELARGKAIGCAIIFAVDILVCLVCTVLVERGGSPLAWIAVALAGAATYLWLMPVSTLFSAWLPVSADLSKTGTGGNPHGLAMLVGSLLLLALAVPPGLALAITAHHYGRPGLALLLISLWTLIAAALSIPLLGLAARAIGPRRENIALVARER